MLLNLLSNAIKFTPYGGVINIKAKKIAKPEELSIDDDKLIEAVSNNPNKTFLEMQVEDNGMGISSNDMPKLF